MNQFNNIAKGSNESVANFNTRFQKEWKRLPPNLQLNDNVCLVNYYNDFDVEMIYHLLDNTPQILREVYKMEEHIDNISRATSKLGRRDDTKFLRNPKRRIRV